MASFWFRGFGLAVILGRKAWADVDFFRLVVGGQGKCCPDIADGREGVAEVGVEVVVVGRFAVEGQAGLVAKVEEAPDLAGCLGCHQGHEVFIHPPRLLPCFGCFLSDHP